MPNYLYIDAHGQKQGPVNDQQLKTLATKGVIVPDTPLATDTGHKGLAGQIPGLFDAPPPPVETKSYGSVSSPAHVKPSSFSATAQAVNLEVEQRVSAALRTRDSIITFSITAAALFAVIVIGVVLWRNTPKSDVSAPHVVSAPPVVQKVEKRRVYVQLSVAGNPPPFRAEHELWINGEKVASKEQTNSGGTYSASHAGFYVDVPTGKINIEAIVKCYYYSSSSAPIFSVKRRQLDRLIPEKGDIKSIEIEVF